MLCKPIKFIQFVIYKRILNKFKKIIVQKTAIIDISTITELIIGDPYGNRTHDSTLRGWRLSRLTKGPYVLTIYL